jgi:tetratricopeptide (TPR) repeat protein
MMQAENWPGATKRLEAAYDALIARADRLKDDAASQLAEQAGLWTGECYEQMGDFGRAQAAYNRVVARNNRSIPGRIGVAKTEWAQGRLEAALDQYRLVMPLEPPPGALADFVRLALLVNLQRKPENRSWVEVEDALEKAEQLKPLPTSIAILKADFLISAKGATFEDAERYLEREYPDQKSRPADVWVTLATLEERQGHLAKALACLDDAQRLGGDQVEFRLARAGHLARHGEGKVKDDLLALEKGGDRFPDPDCRRLLRGLAAAYAQAKLTEEAKDLWQRLARKMKYDLQSRLALFDLAASANDTDANLMKQCQDEIQEIEGPDGLIWRQLRIYSILIEVAKKNENASPSLKEASSLLKEASSLLKAIKARQPDSPNVLVLEARIRDDLEKQPDDALPQYMRAIDLGVRDPAIIARAFNLLVERGRLADANRVVSHMPAMAASTLDSQRTIGEVALRSKDPADLLRAMSVADAVVKSAPDDYRGRLLLGQACWANASVNSIEAEKLKLLKQAHEQFRKANKLAPTDPATWQTLVQFLVLTNQMEAARDATDAAQGVLAGPKGLAALAQLNSRVGRPEKAAELFGAAVAAAGDKADDADALGSAALFYLNSGRQKEAHDLLERLKNNPDRKWKAQASYILAAETAARGRPDALSEALRLIESAGSDATALSVLEKGQQERSRAQAYAMQPFREQRLTAVQILQSLIDRKLATPSDHLLAAQLYEALGDLPKARARYTALLTLPGASTPTILGTAGRFLIRHGDLDGAALALAELKKQPVQTAATIELQARLFHAQNQTKEAVTLLEKTAEIDGISRAAVAGVLEELGQFEKAETQLRKRPEDVLTLAQFLIRRGDPSKALAECNDAWSRCPPVAVAETCLAALAAMPPDASAVDRVAAHVDAARAKSPEDVSLLAALAAVRNFQGRFDQSIELYRSILEKDARQVTALNNLAWLLALKGGHADEALKLVESAVKISGPNPDLLDTRAVAYLAMTPPVAMAAVKDLKDVVKDAPSPTAYFHLAQAQLQAGQRKEALDAWRKANDMRLDPQILHPRERAAYDQLVAALGRPTT